MHIYDFLVSINIENLLMGSRFNFQRRIRAYYQIRKCNIVFLDDKRTRMYFILIYSCLNFKFFCQMQGKKLGNILRKFSLSFEWHMPQLEDVVTKMLCKWQETWSYCRFNVRCFQLYFDDAALYFLSGFEIASSVNDTD